MHIAANRTIFWSGAARAIWRLWRAMLNIEKVGSPLWDRMQKKIADNYVTAFWDPPKHMGFYMDFFLRIDCGALYTRFLILWSSGVGAHVYRLLQRFT